jgi:hypothetical protein
MPSSLLSLSFFVLFTCLAGVSNLTAPGVTGTLCSYRQKNAALRQSTSVDLSSTCHSRIAANNPIETETRKGWSALGFGITPMASPTARVDREQDEYA